MELVHKKISLEPFRSRQKSTIPFSGMDSGTTYDNLNWGQLAYGVNFNDENYWIYDEESGIEGAADAARERRRRKAWRPNVSHNPYSVTLAHGD